MKSLCLTYVMGTGGEVAGAVSSTDGEMVNVLLRELHK